MNPPIVSPLPLRGRAFKALVLTPEAPLSEWLAGLDATLKRSPTLFEGRALVLDARKLVRPAGRIEATLAEIAVPGTDRAADAPAEIGSTQVGAEPVETAPVETEAATILAILPDDLSAVLAALAARRIRLLGIEGIEGLEASCLPAGAPPLLVDGRPVATVEIPSVPAEPEQLRVTSLVVEGSVRSGQSIINPTGDVTVMGSVSSGAEILAGGSIHVFGALRGRAIAGAARNPQARIYCRKFEPELLGIDRLVRTAEDMNTSLRGKPAQIWLDGGSIKMASLD